jgi:transaldolase
MYADGADLVSIRTLRENNLVKGFTTNPTLMKAAGIKDYLAFAREAIQIVNPLPISLEVFADDFDEMERQAILLNGLGDNVYVKIPITNTKQETSYHLIRKLAKRGIKLNVTAIFTQSQIDGVLENIDPNTSVIISIFAGRIADAGLNPVETMQYAIKAAQKNSNVYILWASPREIYNLIEAENSGCHIITMTPDLWKKMANLGKDLSQFSLETVQMFYNDAHASGFNL